MLPELIGQQVKLLLTFNQSDISRTQLCQSTETPQSVERFWEREQVPLDSRSGTPHDSAGGPRRILG